MQTRNRERTTACTKGHESGSVLVIALIMIVLLTIIGISASKTSEIEIMIAGNERVAKENFYLAEGAVRRAAMVMENEDLQNNPPDWVYEEIDPSDTSKREYEDMATGAKLLPASDQTNPDLPTPYDFLDVESLIHEENNWDDTYSQQIAGMGTDTRILAIKKGLAAKTSAKATGSMPYDFAVYGRSKHRNGMGLVVVGYRKAY
jgi:hypothetical protein